MPVAGTVAATRACCSRTTAPEVPPSARAVGGYLHEIERQRPAEYLAPRLDHHREFIAVECGVRLVGFALIPDGSGEGRVTQRVDHGVVERADLPEFAFRLLFPRGDHLCVLAHDVGGGPDLDGSSAPRRVDQSDGLLEFIGEAFAEKITYGAEIEGAFGGAHLPAAFAVVLRIRGAVLRDGEEAVFGDSSGFRALSSCPRCRWPRSSSCSTVRCKAIPGR